MPILGSPGSEWLLSLAALNSLTNLFSMCVPNVLYSLSTLLIALIHNPLSNDIVLSLLRWYVLSRYSFGHTSNFMTRNQWLCHWPQFDMYSFYTTVVCVHCSWYFFL